MVTAIFAASVALVQNDIKKIVAYSTCSQLGYMFFAAGIGAYHVAMFHLFTHAFFKALLFLGAGSVIHAFKDEQDIRNMGGVRHPHLYVYADRHFSFNRISFFIRFLLKRRNYRVCISKIPIWEIVDHYWYNNYFLTSIYSWRLFFKTFHGSYNNKKFKLMKLIVSFSYANSFIFSNRAIFSGYFFKAP